MIHSSSSLLISCDFQILPLPLPSGCHGWFIFHPVNDNDAIWPACFSGGMVQPPTIRSLLVHIHTYIHTDRQTDRQTDRHTDIQTYRHILHCITLHYIHYIPYTYHEYIPCIHTIHSFVRSFVCSFIHSYIHTYILTYLLTYIRTYILTYLPTYVRTYIHTYVHTTCTIYVCARVKSCYYMFIPTFRVSLWCN